MTRRPTRNDPFDHPIFNDRNVSRTQMSSRRQKAGVGSLAAATAGGIFFVLAFLVFAVVALAASGALIGWLGMLAAGILGYPVSFLAVAWPLGTITAIQIGILRKKN